MARSYNQLCPIARTLDLIGDRWSLLILRDLFFRRTKFTELLAHSPGMPARMLSDRLKAFERGGLVERRIYSTHPLRAEYLLTEKGRSLASIIEAIVSWGLTHVIDDDERPVVMQRIKDDVATVPGGAEAMGWQAGWVRQQSSGRAQSPSTPASAFRRSRRT